MENVTCPIRAALCLLLAAAIIVPVAFAAGDDYLEALESEAVSGSPVAATPARTAEMRQELEQALRSEHPSSYQLYRQLNAEQRDQVTDAYAQRRSLSSATRKIVELYVRK